MRILLILAIAAFTQPGANPDSKGYVLSGSVLLTNVNPERIIIASDTRLHTPEGKRSTAQKSFLVGSLVCSGIGMISSTLVSTLRHGNGTDERIDMKFDLATVVSSLPKQVNSPEVMARAFAAALAPYFQTVDRAYHDGVYDVGAAFPSDRFSDYLVIGFDPVTQTPTVFDINVAIDRQTRHLSLHEPRNLVPDESCFPESCEIALGTIPNITRYAESQQAETILVNAFAKKYYPTLQVVSDGEIRSKVAEMVGEIEMQSNFDERVGMPAHYFVLYCNGKVESGAVEGQK